MPFLLPNQQRQSTEKNVKKISAWLGCGESDE